MANSPWMRSDRGPVRRLILDGEPEPGPLWDSTERPPDPMGWRVRTLIGRYLSPKHAEALEDRFFLQKSWSEMADERGVTRHAVRALVERAKENFIRAFGEKVHEVLEVPDSEY